jgi:hypothetical protein
MPRPKNGYLNAAGQPIPGTNDITGRYKDSGALIHWAHKQGQQGLPLYDRSAIDIGSAVHKMAELDLIGASDREIESALHNYLSAPNHLQMAHTSFRAFREWREQCRVTPIKQEVSLVSERYQYGGTPDLVAMVNNGIGLIDFKTGRAVYNEMKVALAAHGNLWNEARPTQKLDSYHLIILPKDGGPFQHHAFEDLSREWELFQAYLKAYSLEKARPTKQAKPKPVEKPAKPRIRVKAQSAPVVTLAEVLLASDLANHVFQPEHQLSMTEILRAYGHVPEVRA